MTDLTEMIRKKASQKEDKAVIGYSDCIELARKSGIKLKDVEIQSLEEDIVPARYERNIGTLGIEGQLRLLGSKVAVIGCGGLGGTVTDILARAGVGSLVLVDSDRFSESNLNRQLLCEVSNLGKLKAQIAAERVKRINPGVETEIFNALFDENTGREILAGVNCAVDCLDNNSSRKKLYSLCSDLGIAVVHGAIGGFTCQAGVYLPGGTTHLDLFGEGCTDKGAEVISGVPSFAPYLAGSIEACEVIKFLSGVGDILRERLWLLDTGQLFSEILPLGDS